MMAAVRVTKFVPGRAATPTWTSLLFERDRDPFVDAKVTHGMANSSCRGEPDATFFLNFLLLACLVCHTGLLEAKQRVYTPAVGSPDRNGVLGALRSAVQQDLK